MRRFCLSLVNCCNWHISICLVLQCCLQAQYTIDQDSTQTTPDSSAAWWTSPFADALTPYNDWKHCSCTIRLRKSGQPPQAGPLGFWRSGRHQPLCWGPWAGRAALAGSGEPCDRTQIRCWLSSCIWLLEQVVQTVLCYNVSDNQTCTVAAFKCCCCWRWQMCLVRQTGHRQGM